MSEIKHTPTEEPAFEQWVEEYRKGKPYWSTARIEICRDAWMERAKRDAGPELLEALQWMTNLWQCTCAMKGWEPEHAREYERAKEVLAKATGA